MVTNVPNMVTNESVLVIHTLELWLGLRLGLGHFSVHPNPTTIVGIHHMPHTRFGGLADAQQQHPHHSHTRLWVSFPSVKKILLRAPQKCIAD